MSTLLPAVPYTGQDFYVPSYQIFVRGKKLHEETNDITSVTYTDSLTAIDYGDVVRRGKVIVDFRNATMGHEVDGKVWKL